MQINQNVISILFAWLSICWDITVTRVHFRHSVASSSHFWLTHLGNNHAHHRAGRGQALRSANMSIVRSKHLNGTYTHQHSTPLQRFKRINRLSSDVDNIAKNGPLLKMANNKKAKSLSKSRDNQNISHLLDQLLYGYDSHVRPNFGGPPVEVLIDFHIRSMGPISEMDMTYVIDCYFRQTWTDHRLAYKSIPIFETISADQPVLDVPIIKTRPTDPYNNILPTTSTKQSTKSSNQKALALSIYMLDRIWKPPTYFLNSRQSHMHTITLPNKFVRIYSNGRVLYSSRMTIKANCPMNLENFPMDTQRCPLSLGSFGYTSNDLVYNWNPTRKVVINPDMKMSQFDLIAVPVHSHNSSMQTSASSTNRYSVLVATFHFKRHMGSFLIEVYAPCIMLVVLSWVGFWINREATADRVTLGLTTVLTMTFLGLELRNDLPKVPYLTALDYFVYISFAFISATILEFGFVHFFTKIGSGELYFMPMQETNLDEFGQNGDRDDADGEDNERSRPNHNRALPKQSQSIDPGHLSRSVDCIVGQTVHTKLRKRTRLSLDNLKTNWTSWSTLPQHFEIEESHDSPSSHHSPDQGTEESQQYGAPSHFSHYGFRLSTFRNSFQNRIRQSFRNRTKPKSHCSRMLTEHRHRVSGQLQDTSVRVQLNSVSQIDRISRVIFPIAFILMNFIYWFIYLRAERNIDQRTLKL